MTYVNSSLKKARGGRKSGKIYPHTWVTGPDPWLHDQYYAWLKHRSQAQYRGEDYNFTWEDWQYFWFTEDRWRQRGRDRDSLVLTRIDPEKAWSRENCMMMTRVEHLRAKNAANPRFVHRSKKRRD